MIVYGDAKWFRFLNFLHTTAPRLEQHLECTDIVAPWLDHVGYRVLNLVKRLLKETWSLACVESSSWTVHVRLKTCVNYPTSVDSGSIIQRCLVVIIPSRLFRVLISQYRSAYPIGRLLVFVKDSWIVCDVIAFGQPILGMELLIRDFERSSKDNEFVGWACWQDSRLSCPETVNSHQTTCPRWIETAHVWRVIVDPFNDVTDARLLTMNSWFKNRPCCFSAKAPLTMHS